jgi:phosphoribosylpyrophosphate synthetase
MDLLGKIEPFDRVIIPVEPMDRFARKLSKELDQPWKPEGLFAHFVHEDDDYDPKLLLEGKDGFNDEPMNRLKGKHVYLVASHKEWNPSLLFERICHTADICLSNGAKEVNLVWTNIRLSGNHLRPGHGLNFTEKDIKKYDGKSLSTLRLAKRLKNEGIAKVLTLHSHSKNLTEAFGEVYFGDPLKGSKVLIDLPIAPIVAHYLYTYGKIKNKGEKAVFVSTDDGSKELGTDILRNLQRLQPEFTDISWVRFNKERDPVTGYLKNIYEAESSPNYNGHENKDKFIFDDIVRSFASMYGVIEKMGGDRFTMFATHAHLTGRSQNLLRSEKIKEIIFTNTMANNLEDPYYEHQLFGKTTVIKIGKYLANAVLNIMEDGNDADEFYTIKSPADIQKIERLYDLRKPFN